MDWNTPALPADAASWPQLVTVLVATVLLAVFVRHIGGARAPVDYFVLSGVPRPKPLLNFSITDARPRPYRPFRFPYHQTMGTYRVPTRARPLIDK